MNGRSPWAERLMSVAKIIDVFLTWVGLIVQKVTVIYFRSWFEFSGRLFIIRCCLQMHLNASVKMLSGAHNSSSLLAGRKKLICASVLRWRILEILEVQVACFQWVPDWKLQVLYFIRLTYPLGRFFYWTCGWSPLPLCVSCYRSF